MPAKAIYVKEADVTLWERAESYARSHRLSMSALLMTALEEWLESPTAGQRR